MKPSEIRRELLEQHAALRTMIEGACAMCEQWAREEASLEDVRACLADLAGALYRHNRREEELLRGVMVPADAPGPTRAEIMGEEHIKEHFEAYTAFQLAADASDARVTAHRLAVIGARIFAHMHREEEAFLAADALRDDTVTGDPT